MTYSYYDEYYVTSPIMPIINNYYIDKNIDKNIDKKK